MLVLTEIRSVQLRKQDNMVHKI